MHECPAWSVHFSRLALVSSPDSKDELLTDLSIIQHDFVKLFSINSAHLHHNHQEDVEERETVFERHLRFIEVSTFLRILSAPHLIKHLSTGKRDFRSFRASGQLIRSQIKSGNYCTHRKLPCHFDKLVVPPSKNLVS